MLVVAILCAIPCFLLIFVYGFESPTYKVTEELWNQLFSETEVTVEEMKQQLQFDYVLANDSMQNKSKKL